MQFDVNLLSRRTLHFDFPFLLVHFISKHSRLDISSHDGMIMINPLLIRSVRLLLLSSTPTLFHRPPFWSGWPVTAWLIYDHNSYSSSSIFQLPFFSWFYAVLQKNVCSCLVVWTVCHIDSGRSFFFAMDKWRAALRVWNGVAVVGGAWQGCWRETAVSICMPSELFHNFSSFLYLTGLFLLWTSILINIRLWHFYYQRQHNLTGDWVATLISFIW